jgi:single-strand DNA-binding protein
MLIGNLTRDPVIRVTVNGSVVCTFGLATNSTWKDSKGNVQERTEFHNIVAWNKLGEICSQLLSVGMAIYLEGELRTRTWEDTNGVKHFRTEIKLQDMKIQDDKGKKGVGFEKAKQIGDKFSKDDIDSEVIVPEVTVPETVVLEDDNSVVESSKEDGEDLF